MGSVALCVVVICCCLAISGHGASVSASQAVSVEAVPGYHFRPVENWINGPMYYKGFYHLFYQYNPKAVVWDYDIVWAHAVSRNLIDWTLLEPAIFPSKQFDIKACWSGSATVLPGGLPVLMYTGIDNRNHQVQNVAYPSDLSDPVLRNWSKPDYNPIIFPDNGVNASAFRDTSTAWYGPDGNGYESRGGICNLRSYHGKVKQRPPNPSHGSTVSSRYEYKKRYYQKFLRP